MKFVHVLADVDLATSLLHKSRREIPPPKWAWQTNKTLGHIYLFPQRCRMDNNILIGLHQRWFLKSRLYCEHCRNTVTQSNAAPSTNVQELCWWGWSSQDSRTKGTGLSSMARPVCVVCKSRGKTVQTSSSTMVVHVVVSSRMTVPYCSVAASKNLSWSSPRNLGPAKIDSKSKVSSLKINLVV